MVTFEWETDKRQIWHVLKRCSEEANRLTIDKDFLQSQMVSLEEEIIDKDFPQSYWRALQLFVQSKTNKTGFLHCVSQASHAESHGLLFKFNYY